jgi:hypothetical protein
MNYGLWLFFFFVVLAVYTCIGLLVVEGLADIHWDSVKTMYISRSEYIKGVLLWPVVLYILAGGRM